MQERSSGYGHCDEPGEEAETRAFAVSIWSAVPVPISRGADRRCTARCSWIRQLVVFAGFAQHAEAQEYVTEENRQFDVGAARGEPRIWPLVADLLEADAFVADLPALRGTRYAVEREPQATASTRSRCISVDIFDAATGETKFRRRTGLHRAVSISRAPITTGLVFHIEPGVLPGWPGWEKLAKTLKDAVDPELIEQLERFESAAVPGRPSISKVAVRVIDDAGTTSEVVLDLELGLPSSCRAEGQVASRLDHQR